MMDEEDLVLLWSDEDRDWEPKLNAIKVNPQPDLGNGTRHVVKRGRQRGKLPRFPDAARAKRHQAAERNRRPNLAVSCHAVLLRAEKNGLWKDVLHSLRTR